MPDPTASHLRPVDQLSAEGAFAELARIDFAHHDLRGVLGQVAGLAKRTLVSNGEVSVTLIRGTQAYTAAFTGDSALALDETQYESGYGPCMDAAGAAETLVIADMATDERWPAFARTAVDAGVLSSLSISLPIQDSVVGALNVYAVKPHAFDADAIALGRTFAGYAAVAIANAHLLDNAAATARQMGEAMEYRAVIEQAKGILMGGRRCTPEEAFSILRNLSNSSNRKLRDVAAALVEEAQRDRPA
jgi:GAF domain-containing protein